MQSEPRLFLVFLTILIRHVSTESLIERLEEELIRKPIVDLQSEQPDGSDAISGPRSVNQVGTFRGKPIITRQKNLFVDNEGVPVPV